MNKILANKKVILLIIIVIVFLIFIGIFYYFFKSKIQLKEVSKKVSEISTPGQDLLVTLEELKKLKVPEPSDLVQEQSAITTPTLPYSENTEVKSELAIPEEVISINPQSESKIDLRNFVLSIRNNQVFPKEIRVYSGDVIDIDIKAIDNNYDFQIPSYGLRVEINKGETKKIQFQTSDIGKFIFECSLCLPKFTGSIIVIPR